MLILNSTTFYYSSLSNSVPSEKKGGINDWVAGILSDEKPMSRCSTSTHHSAGISAPSLANAAGSTQSSSNSVLSRRVTITQKAEPTSSGIRILDHQLLDEDETMGVECEAAVTSPFKGKRCATSAAIVKVSPVRSILCPVKKKLGNNDLPDRVEPKTWRRSFVSTYMQYVVSLLNPWDIPAKLACKKMQLIWDTVFPDIEYEVTSTSTVYHIAIQHVMDSWRSSIGMAGIVILTAYFNSQADLKVSNENCVAFSTYALDKLRFLYHNVEGDDKQKFHGLYQGALVVQTFATHFGASVGACKISRLNASGEAILEACGALVLSCASVQQALTLVATGTLTIKIIHAAKGKNVMLPRTLNYSTGKVSNQQTGFNDITWGETTCKYAKSIMKAYKKKSGRFNEIITHAKELSKMSHHTDDNASGAPDGDAAEEDDDLDEELVDITSSDEDMD
ncbi:hypothetical protein BJV78DRAFT_1289384 [Lactifluus subvellereus]|nr:hypothetical protein BJV78DRAFT_1289384 [Lactifluus subvellereus]